MRETGRAEEESDFEEKETGEVEDRGIEGVERRGVEVYWSRN